MSVWYAVRIKIGSKADQMTVEAGDALIAALKVKSAHPELRSRTCASRTPAVIGAIRTPIGSVISRPSRPQTPPLRQRHLINDGHLSSRVSSAAETLTPR